MTMEEPTDEVKEAHENLQRAIQDYVRLSTPIGSDERDPFLTSWAVLVETTGVTLVQEDKVGYAFVVKDDQSRMTSLGLLYYFLRKFSF